MHIRTTKPFRYPVQAIGLPNYRLPDLADGTETLRGLTPEFFCRLYWMLWGIRVYLRMRIKGKVVEKAFLAEVGTEPFQRFEESPRIRTVIEEEDAIYGCVLQLGSPRVWEVNKVLLIMDLFYSQLDEEFSLGAFAGEGGADWQKTVDFCGTNLLLYGSGDGVLEECVLEPLWLEVEH